LEASGQSPEAVGAARREQAIDAALRLGGVPTRAWGVRLDDPAWPTTGEDWRKAWIDRRERLLAEYARPPIRPGWRPWAWWLYEAGRAQHLVSLSEALARNRGPDPIDERADAWDEWHIEPLVFLASRGDLREDELEELAAKAEEARRRVGTGAECIGSGGVDRSDRRRVKAWEAVTAAIDKRNLGGAT